MNNSLLRADNVTVLVVSLNLISAMFMPIPCYGQAGENIAPLATVSGPGAEPRAAVDGVKQQDGTGEWISESPNLWFGWIHYPKNLELRSTTVNPALFNVAGSTGTATAGSAARKPRADARALGSDRHQRRQLVAADRAGIDGPSTLLPVLPRLRGPLSTGTAARIHSLEELFIRAAAELFPVKFLERVHLGANDVFVYQERLHVVPPLIVSRPELRDHFGMLGNDVRGLARVILEVV